MTAEDVKFSVERVTEPGKEKKKSPQYGNIRAIKDVRIVDAETIHIVTDKPFPLLLERLVFFPIVPKKHIEKVGDDAFGTSAAIGTGPWKLVEWKRDQYIRLEAFEGHWRGKPAFKHLVFRAVPEVATQIAEMKTGGVDLIRNVSADLIPEMKDNPATYVSSTPILRVHYVELDMRQPPFDKKPCQAANYAIDKQAIIQKLMGGLGQQVSTVVQPLAFGFDAECSPSLRSQEAKGPGPGRFPERCGHQRPQCLRGVPPGLRGHHADADRRRSAHQRPDVGPRSGLEQVLPDRGQGHQRRLRLVGQLLGVRRRRRAAPALPHRAGRLIGKHYTRVGPRQAHRRGALHGGPAAAQADIRPDQKLIATRRAIYLFTQYDTLAISKKWVRPRRQWLWLYDAKPKK
jgi:hypothetical protein